MELGGRRESSLSAGISAGDDVKPSLDELLLDEERQQAEHLRHVAANRGDAGDRRPQHRTERHEEDQAPV